MAFGGSVAKMTAVVLAIAFSAAASSACGADYIHEDARISGDSAYTFTDGDVSASIIPGSFRMTLGSRIISGRDAVVWIKDYTAGSVVRREIRVYIDSQAQVREPSVGITREDAMLVTILQQGRLTGPGKIVEGKGDFAELYQRAVSARRESEAAATRPAPTTCPTTATSGPATAPSETGGNEAFVVRPVGVPTTPGTKLAKPKGPASKPAPGPEPVSVEADSIHSQVVGQQRVTVAKGNVYISQGNQESLEVLELRCQAAVIFSRPGGAAAPPVTKDTHSPLSLKLPGGPEGETLIGVYMEEDVTVVRGEQTLWANVAYYDFTTDRATLLDAVFRTAIRNRNVPLYIRSPEVRMLSAREMQFCNAVVTPSDFVTPEYSFKAASLYLKDVTPYDEKGKRLGNPTYFGRAKDEAFEVYGLPVLWWPQAEGEFERSETPLERIQFGALNQFGFGVQTYWNLFRLLGLVEPQGFRAQFELAGYEKGMASGVNMRYARRELNRDYSGYTRIFGAWDAAGTDTFGSVRQDIPAPQIRGRALERHKEFLPDDWMLQFELSYISDRNFLEQYFPTEYYAGKEQETLIYAQKQRDNWVFDALLQYRLNSFQSQAESYPDVGFQLIGEPLAGDKLSFFSDSHAGAKRWKYDEALDLPNSDTFIRGDTRNELDVPLKLGPVNFVPFVTGRATGWGATPASGHEGRLYGQVGVKADMHFWRLYDCAQSRLFDVNRLKHIITPEVVAFFADDGGVNPNELYPMDGDIERHLTSLSGVVFGVMQRLQTKRGQGAEEHTVDWMRLNIQAGFFQHGNQGFLQQNMPGDGRYFFYRPEYSIGRNFINAEYMWQISDTTALLSDLNWDIASHKFQRFNIGFEVQHDPRLAYYLGMRYIDALNSNVGTLGVRYQLSRKYVLNVFQQYDFRFDKGRNLATSVSIIRKFPRWYGGLTFQWDQRDQGDNFGLYITIWPEGYPEATFGTGKLGILSTSRMN